MTPRQLLLTTACCVLLAAPHVSAADIPKVVLSTQHKAMCKVGVGDVLPVTAMAADAKLGKQATVVVYAKGDGWMTRQLFKDLGPDVEKRFADRGVVTQVIHSGIKLKQPLTATMVTDQDGKRFAQIGSGALPRVYVLDAKGNIVWFDLEYTQSTRRELRQTLSALASEKQA